MQLTHLTALLALLPSLALATPIAAAEPAPVEAAPVEDMSHLLTKRGIDFCPPTTRHVGDPCVYQSGDDAPHACGQYDPRAILHCVRGKWAIERLCPSGKCKCTSGSGARGDITCG